ncbi:MAG: chromate efflux transporter [Solirubrobacterales bacterium]
MPDQIKTQAVDTPGSIFLRFLKFGALAWGGPAAQIEMIRKECVEDHGWVTAESFQKTLAVYQVLPGPEAHELCVYFGRIRGGKLGGFLAGLGFMLPGFILMLALSVAYVKFDLAGQLNDVFYGLNAAVGALVARAVLRLGQNFITDVPLALIAVAAFTLTMTGATGFVLILLAAGVAYEIWTNRHRWSRSSNVFALPTLPFMPLSMVAVGAIGLSLGAEIFFEGLKAGLLTFGGAYTVIPFLQQASVETHGWLTDSQFVDGLALSGALPAPLIIFSTFVGYIAGGLTGALLMTFAIFLPAFIFPIFFHRQLVSIAESPRIRPFLLGVAAAVIGLISAVTIEILRTGVVDVFTGLLAAVSFFVLYRFHSKLTVVGVVLGCGLIGAAWQML